MFFTKILKLVVLVFPLISISCARTDLEPKIFKGTQKIEQKSLKILEPSLRSSLPRKILIKKGDTLFRISRKYGVALRNLIEINGLHAPYLIKKGKFLKIPGVRFHVAQVNETIYGIARAHEIHMRSLVKINKLLPPYKIRNGDRIKIPYSKGQKNSYPWRTNESKIQKNLENKKRKVTNKLEFQKSFSKRKFKTKTKNFSSSKTPSLSNSHTGKFLWPVKGKIIVSFGPRKNGFYNDGINIAAKSGTPVRAVEKGMVAYVGNQLQGFGNLVLIRHSNGWMSAYAHSSTVFVRRGNTVQRGQVIAKVGQTGNVGRPQLHFELRRGDSAVDPKQFLTRNPFFRIKSLFAFQAALQSPV